ncbi:MAG: glycosyltransferase family 4 protein [Clostridiales bacterium]|nr:glycosyltransferase family 4 protein [Clostridiales bacterium]
MKTFLYVIKYPLDDHYSIKKKVDGQTATAAALGLDVWQTAYDRQQTYLLHQGEKKPVKRIWFGRMPGYIHTKAFLDLFDSVTRTLRSQSFDAVYMRHCPIGMSGVRMMRRIAKAGSQLVVEIPSFPLENEGKKNLLRRLYWAYSQFCWKRAARYVTRFVVIGGPADSYLGRPALNIDNGVDVDAIPLRQHQPAEDGKTHFLALATMARWHGFDRLIQGVAQMPQEARQQVVVDMVGSEGDGSLARWQQLVQDLGMQDFIRFHSYQTGKALDQVFATADVGICSLGLHRHGYQVTSHLKLREYTARGLPFVYAGDDPSLAAGMPFCLKIPADDSPVPMEEAVAFALRMKEKPEIPAEMRRYARDHMSWEAPMKKALNLQ